MRRRCAERVARRAAGHRPARTAARIAGLGLTLALGWAACPPLGAQEGPESPVATGRWIGEVLPGAYPRLVAALAVREGPVVCPGLWPEADALRFAATGSGVEVEGRLPPATSGAAGMGYRLTDRDGDARPDEIVWHDAAAPDAPWRIETPADDTSLTLWYEALAAGLDCLEIAAPGG